MATTAAQRDHVPVCLTGYPMFRPESINVNIERLRRPGETGNHVIHRVLNGATLEFARASLAAERGVPTSTLDAIDKLLKDAVAALPALRE